MVLYVLYCVGVDLEAIARATTGFSGADLANLVNQSALKASLMNRDAVTDEDMEYAMYVRGYFTKHMTITSLYTVVTRY